jgi:hypothetical protein
MGQGWGKVYLGLSGHIQLNSGPVPSAASTAGGTEFDTPPSVGRSTTSSRRLKVRRRARTSNAGTMHRIGLTIHRCTSDVLHCAVVGRASREMSFEYGHDLGRDRDVRLVIKTEVCGSRSRKCRVPRVLARSAAPCAHLGPRID